jgi:hypothetical protein
MSDERSQLLRPGLFVVIASVLLAGTVWVSSLGDADDVEGRPLQSAAPPQEGGPITGSVEAERATIRVDNRGAEVLRLAAFAFVEQVEVDGSITNLGQLGLLHDNPYIAEPDTRFHAGLDLDPGEVLDADVRLPDLPAGNYRLRLEYGFVGVDETPPEMSSYVLPYASA